MSAASYEKTSSPDAAGFRGSRRLGFMLIAAAMFAGFLGSAGLLLLGPASYSGSGTSADLRFEVAQSAVQPVKIVLSHTFPLSLGGYTYTVTDGIDRVPFTMVVRNREGSVFATREDRIVMPDLVVNQDEPTTGSRKVDITYEVELPPGTYILSFRSDATIDVRIVQRSAYEMMSAGLLILGASMLVALVIFSVALARSQAPPRRRLWPMPAPASPAPASRPVQAALPLFRSRTVPYPPPPPAGPPADGAEQAARRSSLEYVPGRFYTEIVCTNCGWPIRTPPVFGVVTCGHCGEQGRLY